MGMSKCTEAPMAQGLGQVKLGICVEEVYRQQPSGVEKRDS